MRLKTEVDMVKNNMNYLISHKKQMYLKFEKMIDYTISFFEVLISRRVCL